MKKTISAIVALVIGATVYADTATENMQLARINSVLNAVYPLIAAAKKAAPTDTRVHFRYDWLQRDIANIQAGIAQKINHAPLVPTAVKPLVPAYAATVQTHPATQVSP